MLLFRVPVKSDDFKLEGVSSKGSSTGTTMLMLFCVLDVDINRGGAI